MAEDNFTHSEAEGDVVDASPMSAKGSTGKGSTERYNSKGMRVNSNNVISLRLEFGLQERDPCRQGDNDAYTH